ncbi:MAG: hypothetical protein QOJ08_1297 [Ilumatobacteraceae bacterium]
MMKSIAHKHKRAAASMATLVVFITTVGAPFKWSMMLWDLF